MLLVIEVVKRCSSLHLLAHNQSGVHFEHVREQFAFCWSEAVESQAVWRKAMKFILVQRSF